MYKRNYKVDLAALMRVYETNYAKLVRLLPQLERVGDCCVYEIHGTEFQIDILEATRYTTLISLVQLGETPDYLRAFLRVRLYHDARVAEVCASQQISRIQARYDYPNTKMHQRNEKHQINAFLSDWLAYCLRHGTVKKDISF